MIRRCCTSIKPRHYLPAHGFARYLSLPSISARRTFCSLDTTREDAPGPPGCLRRCDNYSSRISFGSLNNFLRRIKRSRCMPNTTACVATTSVIFLHFSSLLQSNYRLCRVISRPHSTLDEQKPGEQLLSFEIIPSCLSFLMEQTFIDNPASRSSFQ